MTQKEISQLSKQINTLANRFDTLGNQVNTLANRFDTLGNQVNTLANRLDEFIMFSLEHVATKEDLKGFATKEDLFATKEELRCEMNIQKLDIIDRMDDKFANLKGELTVQYKTSDKKFNSLIELLRKRKGISKQEATRLLGHLCSGTAR